MMSEQENVPSPLSPEVEEAVTRNFEKQVKDLSVQLVSSVRAAGGQPPDVLVLLSGLITVVVGSVCKTTKESHTGALKVIFDHVSDRLATGREGFLAEQNKVTSE